MSGVRVSQAAPPIPPFCDLGQYNLCLGLEPARLGLDKMLLDLKLEVIGSVLVLGHVVDDIQCLAANGSD